MMHSLLAFSVQQMSFTVESKMPGAREPMEFNESQIPSLPETVSALLIAGNILVYIFAFCGNIASVIVCVRSKFSRPATRFFIISLALSDFIVANFAIIASLTQILDRYHSWVLGDFMCLITDYTQTFAMMTNGCCLIAIALDRYLTVVRGLKTPFMSPRCASYCSYIFMVLVWAAPLAMSVPLLLIYYRAPFFVWRTVWDETGNFTVVKNNGTYYFCLKEHDSKHFDMWFHIVLGIMYLSLIITLVFSYVSILRFVKKNFSRSPGDPRPAASTAAASATSNSVDNNGTEPSSNPRGSASTMPQNRHRRTVRLLSALIALFLICRLPVWIFLVISTSSEIIPRNKVTTSINYSLHLLSNVKSAINPFVYAIWNDALRSSNNPNNSNRTTSNSRCCNICLSSQNNSQCSLTNLWQWCRRGNPRSYDFTRQGKVASSSATNIQRFNPGDKNEPGFKSTSYWNSQGIQTLDSSA